MHFTSASTHDPGVVERRFTIDDIAGILWTSAKATPSSPVPLILVGHPGGLDQMYPRILGRAVDSAAAGYASVSIELPGSGSRPPIPTVDAARGELRSALAAGQAITKNMIDRLVLPLVDRAVPEWQTTIDALLSLPEISGPVGVSGGILAIGVRLAVVDPRIVAAGLFAGSLVPDRTLAEARHVTIPVHVLLQWDDDGNDRNRSLELFDALGTREKTLQANMGGHTGVPAWAGEDAARFFTRHLG